VLGASAFALGNVLYDSLLLAVAPAPLWDRLSAAGYALGYVGGALALLFALALWQKGHTPLAFALVGGWWACFSLPLFLWVPEPPPAPQPAWGRWLWVQFGQLREDPQALRFLLAFWLYNDGIGTVIKMAGAYGSELSIPLPHLVGALLLAQLVGVPGTLLWGAWAERAGSKLPILAALGVYVGVLLWSTGIRQPWEFWLLAGLVGLVQGGTQALSRSFFARFVPAGGEASYFAFFDVSGRIAGLMGPALFALATQVSGRVEAGVFLTVGFFLGGGGLLLRVKEPKMKSSPLSLDRQKSSTPPFV
jgi:UMF1 family MFS transporter